MTLQNTAQRQTQTGVICRTCRAPMRLLRVDPYPMPRATVEIHVFECSGCHATLQQIQTIAASAAPRRDAVSSG
jgi:hypothetical protein